MTMKSVAAVIVNYRSARLVGELLECIAGRGEGWLNRVFVVDNASGDGSVGTLQKKVADLGIEGRVQVLDSGENRGFGAGNNFGARNALRAAEKPDVLWFLNPDTTVDDVDIEQALEWFERDPRVAIVGTGLTSGCGVPEMGGHRELSPVGEFVRTAGAFGVLRRYASSDPSLDRPGRVDWVSGASLMMRASAFEQLGGFDEGFFLYFEEVDLCRRVRRAGWKVVYEPRVRVVHLEGQTTGVSKERTRPKYWYESRRRFFVKHYGVLGLLRADAAWGLGCFVGAIRRRAADACRWRDLWRCDWPVIVGREHVATGGKG